jgi:hypothetical protein
MVNVGTVRTDAGNEPVADPSSCLALDGGIYLGGFTAVQVAVGDSYSCAVKGDGTIACWGYNQYGQASQPSGSFTQIAAGGSNFSIYTCGLRTDGTVACWGSPDPAPRRGIRGSPAVVLDLWCDKAVTHWVKTVAVAVAGVSRKKTTQPSG